MLSPVPANAPGYMAFSIALNSATLVPKNTELDRPHPL